MRWTRSDIYSTVRDGARHMQGTTEDHYQEMLTAMDYNIATPKGGLFLVPKGEWDGKNPDFKFEMNSKSDSVYTKYKDPSKSFTGCVTYINIAPITYKSSTQKSVSLLVIEEEINAAVPLTQDILFAYEIDKLLGLKVKLPMKVAIEVVVQ